MSDTVEVTYIGPHLTVWVPSCDVYAEQGQTVEVPREVAYGTPAEGTEGEPDFHPGVAGLLAQETNWTTPKAGNPYDGAVDDVLSHVGADANRAQVALAHERANKNRKTLVAKLEEIAGPPQPPTAPAEPGSPTTTEEAGQ